MVDTSLYNHYLAYKQKYPGLRDKRLAQKLQLSEGELLLMRLHTEAVSLSVSQLIPILTVTCKLGYLLCVNRNDQAISESKGYFTIQAKSVNTILLTSESTTLIIDSTQVSHVFALRTSAKKFTHNQFHNNSHQRNSLQLCNASGYVIAKIYIQDENQTTTFDTIISTFVDRTPVIPFVKIAPISRISAPLDEAFTARLRKCCDMRSLTKILSSHAYSLANSKVDGLSSVDYSGIIKLLTDSSNNNIPVIVLLANTSARSIYSNTVIRTQAADGCFNVLDKKFHLHLYQDKVSSVYKIQLACSFATLEMLESVTSSGEIVAQLIKVSYNNSNKAEVL